MNHFEGSDEVTTVTKNTAHRRLWQTFMTVGGPDAAEAGANSAGKGMAAAHCPILEIEAHSQYYVLMILTHVCANRPTGRGPSA